MCMFVSLYSTASIWDDRQHQRMKEAEKDIYCVTRHPFTHFSDNHQLVFFFTIRQLYLTISSTVITPPPSSVPSISQVYHQLPLLALLRCRLIAYCPPQRSTKGWVCVTAPCGHLTRRHTEACWTDSGSGGEDSGLIFSCPSSVWGWSWCIYL